MHGGLTGAAALHGGERCVSGLRRGLAAPIGQADAEAQLRREAAAQRGLQAVAVAPVPAEAGLGKGARSSSPLSGWVMTLMTPPRASAP